MKIYLDLDGVCCNFLKATGDIVGKELKTHEDWDAVRDQAWQVINNLGPGFWSNLAWMPDGRKLWEYIKHNDVVVLSAYPFMEKLRPAAMVGKLHWVYSRLGHEYVLDAKIVPVVKKQEWAYKGNILIDDNPMTIDQWNAKGGIGILHTSTENTIKELKKVGI